MPAKVALSTITALEELLENLRRENPGDDLLSDETALFIMQFGGHLAADSRGVSTRTLRRQFERLGVTLSDHMTSKRQKLALTLLGDSVPIREIARRLGFASAQTFARFIHREFGTTATVLRRRLDGH
jgi:AraC-like DNA-binding protein